jgi:hypothetical protein
MGSRKFFFARLVPLSFKWLGLGLCLVCSFKHVLVHLVEFHVWPFFAWASLVGVLPLRECKGLEDRGFTFSVFLLPRNWEDLFCVSLKECRFVCTK